MGRQSLLYSLEEAMKDSGRAIEKEEIVPRLRLLTELMRGYEGQIRAGLEKGELGENGITDVVYTNDPQKPTRLAVCNNRLIVEIIHGRNGITFVGESDPLSKVMNSFREYVVSTKAK